MLNHDSPLLQMEAHTVLLLVLTGFCELMWQFCHSSYSQVIVIQQQKSSKTLCSHLTLHFPDVHTALVSIPYHNHKRVWIGRYL